MLRFAGFELDELSGELRGPEGETIRLRRKPFALLEAFVANAGRTLSKQELMQAVWPNVHVSEDSLFQCIRVIRRALRDDEQKLIRLVSGRGYLFDAEIVRAPAETADLAAAPAPAEAAATANPASAARVRRTARIPLPALAAALAGLCVVAGLAAGAMTLRPDILAARRPPTIAVTIADPGNDPQTSLMAANVAADLAEGLSKIGDIRVLAPQEPLASAAVKTVADAPAASPDVLVEGRLQKDGQAWSLQAHATRHGEVRWSTSVSVAENVDETLQRSRLAGGLGHDLAVYLNTLYYPGEQPGASDAQVHAKIVVEQATAYIDRTSRERFAASQAMLKSALAQDPDNVDIEAALAADLLRGVQTKWYVGQEAEAAEHKAQSLIERALAAHPRYLPALEDYCRFMTATDRFVEALVACANALTVDPWDGLVRFNLGMAQDELGRFPDALATFEEADRYDTPQVSRWTWLLGAGLTLLLMERDQEALPWLQRSLAITPGTGRTQMLLAVAYQRLGRTDEARAEMAKVLELRPGSTADNVEMPAKNTSPLWREAAEKMRRAEVAAGLPEH
jgi:DNA-binding winged helix-turn-helix (wHTH) protein/Tfp pilus assembly protein PilF/TolB-like protein